MEGTRVLFASLLVSLALLSVAQGQQGIALSSVAEFPILPIDEQSVSVVVSFEAPASVASSDRAPVSISTVLDRSGSMSGNKIDLLKRSTEFLVTQLEDGDFVGVVSYSNNVREDIRLSRVTDSNKGGFRRTIGAIQANGGTNLAGGLFEGIDQQTGADVSRSAVKSVILFTDGLANIGETNIGRITSRMANNLRGSRAPTVYALGFGGDHDARFLQAIAEAGRGSYVFVENERAIPNAIGQVLGGLLTVTAQDIVVDFRPLNGARIVSIKGGRVNGRSSTTFPDLFAEERRDILVNMRVPILDDALEDQEILRVTLTYFNTITRKTEVKRTTIVIDRSLDVVDARPAPLVETTRLRFRVAEDITRAVEQKRSGDTAGASRTLEGTLSAIARSPESSSAAAQSLRSDVESTKSEVESDQFDSLQASRASAGAASVSSQRVVGATGFASARATPKQAETASAAADFTGGK